MGYLHLIFYKVGPLPNCSMDLTAGERLFGAVDHLLSEIKYLDYQHIRHFGGTHDITTKYVIIRIWPVHRKRIYNSKKERSTIMFLFLVLLLENSVYACCGMLNRIYHSTNCNSTPLFCLNVF